MLLIQVVPSVLLIAAWSPVYDGARNTENLRFVKNFISKNGGGRRSRPRDSRVAGDQPEFPFVVSLQLQKNPMLRLCSGSLLSHTWVLTSNHCVTEYPLLVRYADFTLFPNETKAFVKVIKMFDASTRPTIYAIPHDIALVLTQKVPKTAFGKISSVYYKTLLQMPVKYAGYGFTTEAQNIADIDVIEMCRPLQVGQSVVAPCNLPLSFGMIICITLINSNRHKHNYTEGGSTGGPLLYNGEIVGVLTGKDKAMSYYAAIRPQWIQALMNDSELKLL